MAVTLLTAAFFRDLVGWVLLTAGADKALHLEAFVPQLRRLLPWSGAGARLLALLVCAIEIAIGTSLLVGIALPVAVSASFVFLILLTFGSIVLRRQDLNGSCECGGLVDVGRGLTHVGWNALLIASVTLSALIDSRRGGDLAAGSAALLMPQGLVVVALLGLATLLAIRAMFALRALRRTWQKIEQWRAA